MSLLNKLLEEKEQYQFGIYWILQINFAQESLALMDMDWNLKDIMQVYIEKESGEFNGFTDIRNEKSMMWIYLHFNLFDRMLTRLLDASSSLINLSSIEQDLIYIRSQLFQKRFKKNIENKVIYIESSPKQQLSQLKTQIDNYNKLSKPSLKDIIVIHQDIVELLRLDLGAACLARMLVFGECLRLNLIPPIIPNQFYNEYKEGIEGKSRSQIKEMQILFEEGQIHTKNLLEQMNMI